MKRNFWVLLSVLSLGLLVLSACATPSADSGLPETGGTVDTSGIATQIPEAIGTALPTIDSIATQLPTAAPPQVIDAVESQLPTLLSMDVNSFQLVSSEAVNWPDSCLGLGGPAESCAQVITPGYRVIVDVNGTQYEIHTDTSGDIVRVVTP